jgi:hypothetical protein
MVSHCDNFRFQIMSSITLPVTIMPNVSLILYNPVRRQDMTVTILNYPGFYTAHIARDGKVLVWRDGYGGTCHHYRSVTHYNESPDDPSFIGCTDPNTHIVRFDKEDEREIEEGEVVEEGEINEKEEDVEAVVFQKLECEIAEMRCLLQWKKAYLDGSEEIESDEKAAVEEEVFSLGIMLTRKENFYWAVSEGLVSVFPRTYTRAEDNEPENLKAEWKSLGERGKRAREKSRTKASRWDRETARLNKNGVLSQEDQAMSKGV